MPPMPPNDDKPDRVVLLILAAESLLDAIDGCAARIKFDPARPWVAAIDHFGALIVARWVRWLQSRPPQEQVRALEALAQLEPDLTVAAVGDWLQRNAPAAREEDRHVVREYLTAIPTASREFIQSLSAKPETPSALTEPRRLSRFLPINAPPFPIGAEVPGTPYRLEELLGTGGFGAVYRAVNRFEQHAEPRALKFCLNPNLMPSLKRERDLLDRLMTVGGESRWSDRVVKLYGHNLDAPIPFLVYEYIRGGNLVTRLAALRQRTEKELQPGQVLGLIRRICEPVAFAHDLGLVHRDIKPSNVLVSGNTLKLGDFGIGGVVADYAARTVKLADGHGSLSEQGSVFRGAGTPLYMSPEQRRGDPADPRHDVYSIGVIWYQLLVNDHTRELHQGWADELADEFDVPRKHIELIQACVGYLKKRPANAGELLRLLPPPGATLMPSVRASRSGEGRVLASHPASVLQLAFGSDPRRLFSAGGDGVVRVWDADLGVGLAECKPKGRAVQTLAVAQDNRRALFGCDGNVTWLWDVTRNQEAAPLAGHGGRVMCAAFSPDSRRAATGGTDGTVRVWHVATARELLCLAEHDKPVSGLQFSSGDEFLACCDESGAIRFWELETGWEARPALDQQDWLLCLALSPDDRFVACGGKSTLMVWDRASGERVFSLAGHELAVMGVAFTRDGKFLASAGLDNKLHLWEMSRGRLAHTFLGHGEGSWPWPCRRTAGRWRPAGMTRRSACGPCRGVMTQPACPTCGRPGAATPCPHCGSGRESATASDPGLTPPPPGVPALPRDRRRDSKARGPRPQLPRLPGYEVLELLGARGRASVYKARQTGLRRVVALALLHDFAGGADAKNGFRHEAQTLARLGHPHLVQILDVGECASGFYYAMEYCPGGSLGRKLDQGPLAPEQAAQLVEKVARAVQAAHERGVVHGRIGPADVLLTDDGSPKLAGFGQACLLGEEPAGLGEDIRDLGRLLGRCCNEAPPPTLDALRQRCETGAYGSARDLADALCGFLAGERAAPPSGDRLVRLARDARRLRLALAVCFAVVLAILAGVAALYRHARRASLPVDLARAEVWVCAVPGGLTGGTRLSRASEGWLGRYPHVSRVEGCLCGPAAWKTEGGGQVPCLVLSGDLGGSSLGPVGLLPPPLRQKLREPGTVIVCEADLGQLGVSPTDSQRGYDVGSRTVRVIDLAGHPSSPLGPLVFCSPETAREVLGAPPEQVTYVLGECDDPARAAAVVAQVRRENGDVRAYRREELSRELRLRWLKAHPATLVCAAVSLATLTVAAVVLGRGLQSKAILPRCLLAAAVPLLAAAAATAVMRGVIWAMWPGCAEVLRTPLLDFTALGAAALLAGLGAAVAARPGSPGTR
ncbi:MAG: protein kinase [Gemmataceae bacterium]